MRYISILVVVLLWSAPAPSGAQATSPAPGIPAFPGAEGYGANTPGGRGGDVYEVTNLDDAGPGSLRDAISRGHRTVVFRVSGTIDLKSPLRMREPFVTIAGQTAPGDGICVRYYTFNIQTHDVIVRFIRSRLGDLFGQQEDSISILNGCHDVIVDHCSATWSVDECLSTSGHDENITVQRCLIGEGLNRSIHAKGRHGYGSLARADGLVSWYHNLWVHNIERNPRLGDNYGKGPHPTFDVRNNVVYDYGEVCTGYTQGIFTVNYVGNFIRPGPSSVAKFPITMLPNSDVAFYLHGNVVDGNDALTADNAKFISAMELEGKPVAKVVGEPFRSPPFRELPAREAYEAVLAGVGAVLPRRDAVDARIIQEVRDRTGTIIDSQKQVGGWPELKSTAPPADADHDGIPDEWEKRYGLNPNDPADANKDLNGDGYTNLEKYLDGIDPTKKIDWHNPKNNVDLLTAASPQPTR